MKSESSFAVRFHGYFGIVCSLGYFFKLPFDFSTLSVFNIYLLNIQWPLEFDKLRYHKVHIHANFEVEVHEVGFGLEKLPEMLRKLQILAFSFS